jgi:hypothetical protein
MIPFNRTVYSAAAAAIGKSIYLCFDHILKNIP